MGYRQDDNCGCEGTMAEEGVEIIQPAPVRVQVPCCIPFSEDHSFETCQDAFDFTYGVSGPETEIRLNCQVRVFKARVALTNVCPGRRINLAVIAGINRPGLPFIGMKGATFTVPGNVGDPCIPTLFIDEFCFVVPEDICQEEAITVKILAHYSDFVRENLVSQTSGFPI
ncbi:hypothetical protein ACFOU2_14815 [Bacillus songklensis]|uniref:Spore coat protein Z n=1 Tax=Bacillus songklensis TaxID=1069116 RepID=A0ABV8B312_9BACI